MTATAAGSVTRRMMPMSVACALAVLAIGLPRSPAAQQSPAAEKSAAPGVPAGAYTLDKAHASLIFRVNHLGFSNFTGRFTRFDAKLQFDPVNPATDRITATIDPRSIQSDNAPPGFLDSLSGKEWLDADRFPEMTFRSTKVTATGSNAMRIDGELKMHGVTRPVTLQATFNGGYAGHPMDPHARIGFSAHGALKRSAFGIAYGIPAPGTSMGVSDNVEVIIEAEFSGPAWGGAPK